MTDLLEFPEFSWREGSIAPALEVSIDFLPEPLEGQWLDVVREFTASWVKANEFKKSGTIWMWGTMSVNLVSRHPEYPVPSWSDFLVQVGLSKRFLAELDAHSSFHFGGQSGVTEQLALRRDDGWTPVCHVEQGRAWEQVDGDTWAPLAQPKAMMTRMPRKASPK